MMVIAVCDDEEVYRTEICHCAERWGKTHEGAQPVIKTYDSAENLHADWASGLYFDILFLDVELKHMTGLEIANKIRETDSQVPIVFFSGHERYFLKGYEANAYRFLTKPLKKKDVYECLEYAYTRSADARRYDFYLPGKNENIHINLQDVLTVSSNIHHACFTMRQKGCQYSMRMKGKFDDLLEKLDTPYLVRCHSSYAINVLYVRSFTRTNITMVNGENIPISRPYQKNVTYRLLEATKGGML